MGVWWTGYGSCRWRIAGQTTQRGRCSPTHRLPSGGASGVRQVRRNGRSYNRGTLCGMKENRPVCLSPSRESRRKTGETSLGLPSTRTEISQMYACWRPASMSTNMSGALGICSTRGCVGMKLSDYSEDGIKTQMVCWLLCVVPGPSESGSPALSRSLRGTEPLSLTSTMHKVYCPNSGGRVHPSRAGVGYEYRLVLHQHRHALLLAPFDPAPYALLERLYLPERGPPDVPLDGDLKRVSALPEEYDAVPRGSTAPPSPSLWDQGGRPMSMWWTE